MSRDDIIRMAREAGFHAWYSDPDREYHFGCAMKLASLVAAAERKAFVALVLEMDGPNGVVPTDDLLAVIDIRAQGEKK